MICMGWFSLIAVIVLIVLAIALAVMFPLAVGQNLKNGQLFREKLAARLQDLPMGKMLSRLGVGRDKYLHREESVKLHQQMSNCDGCKSEVQCQTDLEDSKTITVDDIDYCPNQEAIRKVSE